MLKKKIQVVMLPTEKAEKCLIFRHNRLNYNPNYLTQEWLKYNDAQSFHLYFLSDEETKNNDWFYDYHTKKVLKCLSNKSGILNEIYSNYKKVVATTDKSLTHLVVDPRPMVSKVVKELPQPSKSFIEKYISEYNKGNIITECLVEYSELFSPDNINWATNVNSTWKQITSKSVLKINRNNEITIHPIKNSWSREEVIQLFVKLLQSTGKEIKAEIKYIGTNKSYIEYSGSDFDDWIEQNL